MKKTTKCLLLFVLICMTSFIAIGCNKNVSQNKENINAEESKSAANDEKKEITLTDNVGRKVTLPYPVKACVVANRYNSELIRASGAIDRVIAVDMNTAQDREYWSEFDPNNTISKGGNDLNYEKIVELNPQVVILPANGSWEEAENKLKEFGIKVFVISGYDTSDFKNQVENIGKMFGTEEKAKKFYDYFNDKLEYIKSRVPEDKQKTLYLEQVTDFQSTIPGDYFFNMQKLAGAKNIFSENYENININEINPEEVINRNPDVIIKFLTADDAMSGTGLYTPPRKEQFKEKLEEIKSRPGWSDIKAVKNNDIYFMTQFSHGGASKLVGTMFIAKWMYPDLVPDLDPYEVFRAWMEDFQGFKNIDGHFYTADELEKE